MVSGEVVCVGVVLCFEVRQHILRSKDVPVQNLRSFEVAEGARLVFVEQIAA